MEQLRIVEREVIDVRVRIEEADLIHDLHEVRFRKRVAVAPCGPAAIPVAAGRRRVFQTDEREASVVGSIRVLAKRPARKTAELRERSGGGEQHQRSGGQATAHATEYDTCKSEV